MTEAADNITSILEERGKRYGKFADRSLVTQVLKGVMRGQTRDIDFLSEGNQLEELHDCWIEIDPDQRQALEMIADKIGRILNGDPNHADSWDDIAGYAKLVGDRLRGVSR